ncbi:CorA metal ion transporter [Actinomortierella ambigua]|uniref:CorA metal ion transporter n=1 Tax=Actinomortierella ambigua TaxID=1343610 RepID=A0A9P6QAF5_9FUNG|nr:CorA metal ion transporter [Actinomortierella ambigua]
MQLQDRLLDWSIHSDRDTCLDHPEHIHGVHCDDSDHDTPSRRGSDVHLLGPSRSSYSYSLPRSLGSNNYSQDSFSGSPLLFGDSFVDRQNMHKQYQDYQLQQQQQLLQQQQQQLHRSTAGQRPSPQQDRTPSCSDDSHGLSQSMDQQQRPRLPSRHNSSFTDTTERAQASHHPSAASITSLLDMPDPSTLTAVTATTSTPPSTTRPPGSAGASFSKHQSHSSPAGSSSKRSQSNRSREGYGSMPARYHSAAETSPSLSESSSRSGSVGEHDVHDHERDITTSTLIMPQITTTVVGSVKSDDHHLHHHEHDHDPLDYSPISPEILREPTERDPLLVRHNSASPVPMHAQLTKLQNEARRGAQVLDMENGGQPRHYDFGDMTDSSYDFASSRRHSIVDDDVFLDDTYRFTLYTTSSVTIHAQTLGEIPGKGQTLSGMLQAGHFWLDVLAPTDDEVKMLSRVFGVHPLTTEDILQEEGREKCEMFLNYYFVCFRTFVLDQSNLSDVQALSVYTLVFPTGVISYHFRPVLHCRNVRKRIRHLKNRVEVTPVETEVDMIDELVLILKESERTDMLRRIGNCRKRVMSLLRLLTGKADVIKGLIKRYEGRLGRKNTGEIGLFMGDIQDHIITMLQNLSHYEKILSRSHSNYLAQINIEMTSASNETNDVLAKLTAMGSILLPMNLVTGLWGMNVPVPGQESEGLAWFFWIVTAIFLAATLFLFIARKLRLL